MIILGQIGAGVWGQNHVRIFSAMKDCHLKTCCDKDREVLKRIKSNYNQRLKLTDNFKDILKDKEINAVIIATPAITHAQFAIQALNCGKHVFVEKPLALNLKDGQKMVELARRNKRILMVGHLLLYHPAVIKLKEYIKKGELGKILYIYSTRVNLGKVREEENVLWSLVSHDIYVAIHLLEKMPQTIQATGKDYIRKYIQDVVFVTLNFDGNVIAHIHASWLDPHKMRKFTIVGSKKMIVFDDMESNEKLRIYDKGFDWQKNAGTYETFLTLREGDIHIPKIDMEEPLKLECQHFINCIAKNQRPFSDGENGLEVLRLLGAAELSLNSNGKTIKL